MTQSHETQPLPEEGSNIRAIIDGVAYILSWQNTIIRQFAVGEGMFDYAMHAPDEDSLVPIFFDQPNGKDLRSQLKTAEFPVASRDTLDQETIDLIERRLRLEIDSWPSPSQITP